ncbi:MAG: cation transporter [Bdellovibrionales bacterium]|nr:cation transporter [Bdellovibrionales bacterium]
MKDCCEIPIAIESKPPSRTFYRVLWAALVINFIMFLVEMTFSLKGKSLSLTADAVDFLGDSINYASSLVVFNSSLQTRAKLSMSKALVMLIYALTVFVLAAFRFVSGELPSVETMSIVGFAALCANVTVALMLYKFREGDSNMQSVWICTRNDVLGNLAVLAASAGVYFTNTHYPDLAVAVFLAAIGIQGSVKILRLSMAEMRMK